MKLNFLTNLLLVTVLLLTSCTYQKFNKNINKISLSNKYSYIDASAIFLVNGISRQIYSNINHSKVTASYLFHAMQISKKQNNNITTISNYINMAVFYWNSGQKDSAFFYMTKIENNLSKINKKRHPSLYAMLGKFYFSEMHDMENAKKYFIKLILTDNNPTNYIYLAQIALKEKDSRNEVLYIKKARLTVEKYKESKKISLPYIYNYYNQYAEYLKEKGHIEEAFDTLKRGMQIYDRLNINNKEKYSTAEKKEKELQVQVYNQTKNKLVICIFCLILLLILSIAIFIIFYQQWKRKSTTAVQKERNKAYYYSQQISSLRQKVSEAEAYQTQRIAKGKILYQKVMEQHLSMKEWHKNEFVCFNSYYQLEDKDFMERIAEKYGPLPAKSITFLILWHIGKTDNEIMSIMNFNNGALRNTRYKIRLRKKEKDASSLQGEE